MGLVRQIRAEHADLAIVVMTAYGSIESAVEAMRLGAEDYLVKPFEAPELLLVIRRAIEFQALKSANRRSIRRNQERFTFRNIVARSAGMHAVFDVLLAMLNAGVHPVVPSKGSIGAADLAPLSHLALPLLYCQETFIDRIQTCINGPFPSIEEDHLFVVGCPLVGRS